MIVLSVVFAVVLVAFIYCVFDNMKLHGHVDKLKSRNPVEVDLELATFDQIMVELRRRPIRYLFVLPEFKVHQPSLFATALNKNESIELTKVSVEASGLPAHVAKDVMTMACSVMNAGQGDFKSQGDN